MYTTSRTAFHIICDEGAQSYLEGRLNLIRRPRHDIKVVFYRLTRESMEARVRREGAIFTDHSAGICAYRSASFNRCALLMLNPRWSDEAIHT
jgi:hypothetical protein